MKPNEPGVTLQVRAWRIILFWVLSVVVLAAIAYKIGYQDALFNTQPAMWQALAEAALEANSL